MIPLECIARREATGSYIKRFPHLKPQGGCPAHRFHCLETEYFLKTSGGKITINGKREMYMPVDVLDAKDGKRDRKSVV